ncbi:MAG: sn-glycerol-3-phosphate ABC transporter ATP-binding protein UgpC [bacterium]|jgi:multiple sugar transport system ATP-binding protein
MAEVVLDKVTKVFGSNVVAVDEASITIADKEFVVLVGPSGCGKSTFLRMIAGLEEATSGEIYIDGKMVNNVAPKDRDIAMVFQNYALYPHMTAFDNMAFGLKLRKYPKDEIAGRVRDAAQILGIENLLDRKPKELSGGQRQRVAVGRAIVRKPKVFLFDEPLSNLDAKLRVQMRTEIEKLHNRLQTTMIYVTHDQIEAMTMGTRIVVLKDGLIQQVADPMTLYDAPVNRFVAGFIGSPAMNFAHGKMAGDGEAVFEEGTFNVPLPAEIRGKLADYKGKDIIFGVRPEDLHARPPEGAGEPVSFKATVEVVEPMGNEIFVYVTTGNTPAVARLTTRKEITPGSQIELFIDMRRIHFFDAGSEATIV